MAHLKLGGTNTERVKREAAVRDRMFKKEKNFLDKNMDVSLRAIEREYKDVVKKQTELVTVKSGIFRDADEAKRKGLRSPASRSHLAAASNRQLKMLYADQGNILRPIPSDHRSAKPLSPKLDKTEIKPTLKKDTKTKQKEQKDTGAIKAIDLPPIAAPAPAHSGKGKGKGIIQTQETAVTVAGASEKTVSHDQHTPTAHQVGTAHQSDQPVSFPGGRRLSYLETLMLKRGSVVGHDHAMRRGSMARRGSQRRESITGQLFSRDEMEEQQRILDLFIHLVDKVEDTAFDPADLNKITDGSNSSIPDKHGSSGGRHGASGSHHSTSGSHHSTSGVHHPAYPHLSAKAVSQIKRLKEDPKLMKDLQSLIERRRASLEKKGTPPNENDEQSHTNGYNRRRRMSGIEMLSDILGAYKTQYVKEVTFDPLAMLNCGYLRLSESNVQELERLCREQGIDPGIHAHSNVTDYRLFD